MKKQLKVLLVSPVRDHDILCGDVIYTELLEKKPPENVTYINYIEALKKGLILERKRLSALPHLWQEHKDLFWADLIPALLIACLNFFRQHDLLIANPWKFFYLKEKFDLVHAHVFPLNLSGNKTPLVISNAITSTSFLRHIKKFPRWRVWLMKNIEIFLCKIFNVQESSLAVKKTTPVILFSEKLREGYKYLPAKNINIIPIGLPPLAQKNKNKFADVFQLGFIAKDFAAKGGKELLEAYTELKKKYGAKINLTIVGSQPLLAERSLHKLDIKWFNLLPRQTLLNKLAPRWDLFVYPSRWDGFPLVVLEMLSLGVPALVSDFYALPEMVGHGQAGAICRTMDTEDLAKKLEKLLDKKLLAKLGKNANAFFAKKYTQAVTNRKLADCYFKITQKGVSY